MHGAKTARAKNVRRKTSFVGREDDLIRIEQLLASAPLVTLVGPAGIGKTRLALQAATAHGLANARAVEIIDLELARSFDDVVAAFARAIDTPLAGSKPEEQLTMLVAALEERGPTLLLFDNAEGCRAALADALDELLTADASVLVTSRIRLGRNDEQVVSLTGLAPEAEGTKLFLDRAASVRPGLERSAAIVDLVAALDGNPLAIELAAARMLSIAPAELAARVRARPLSALASPLGAEDSLRARFAWSLSLLGDAERKALSALSVVHGRLTFAEVEILLGSGASTEQLAGALAEHHLFQPFEGGFVLYNGVRELANETGDPAVLAAAHTRWLAFLEAELVPLVHDNTDAAAAKIEELHPHVREALNVLLARPAALTPEEQEIAALLFACAARVSRARGPLQDIDIFGKQLTPKLTRGTHAYALTQTTWAVAVLQSDTKRARAMLEEVLALPASVVDAPLDLTARVQLAMVHARVGQATEAKALLDAVRPSLSDSTSRARVAHVDAGIAYMSGDITRAQIHIDESVAHASLSGSEVLRAIVTLQAAQFYTEAGRIDEASALYVEGMACCERAGHVNTECAARNGRAELLLFSGRTAEALAELDIAVNRAASVGAFNHMAFAQTCRGYAHLLLGHFPLANANFLDASAHLTDQLDIALAFAGRACVMAQRADADATLELVKQALATAPLASGIQALVRAALHMLPAGTPPVPIATEGQRWDGPRIGVFVAERLEAGSIETARTPDLVCRSTGFQVAGSKAVSLVAKPRLLALYRALADAHREDPSKDTSRAALTSSTWPGERMRADAAANRLRVALSTLRKLGLPLDASTEGLRIASGTHVAHE